MKELHTDRFDALLSLAAAECVKEDAKAFLSADISGIEDNPQMLRRILGRSSKRKWSALKVIALVALLCMSVAFTACMLVPEIRNVVWSVFVKEQGDHVEIEFETNEETEIVTEPPVTDYPKTIEQKIKLAYIPEGCFQGGEVELPTQYQLHFYTNEGDAKFIVVQGVAGGTDSFVDNESGPIAYMQINGYKAVLIEHAEENSMFTLTWQDQQYRYSISGTFSSINEIVSIAEGVRLSE